MKSLAKIQAWAIYTGALIVLACASCDDNEQLSAPVHSIVFTYQVGNGDTVLKRQESFDSAGQLIAAYVFGSRKDTLQKILFDYSADGLLYKATYNGDKISHEEHVRSAGGRILHIIERSGDDTLSIIDHTYYPTGELKRSVVQYVYDPESPITIVTNYARNGKPETVYRQIYEDSSRVVISRMEMDRYTYMYDSLQHLIRSVGTITFGYHESPDTIEDTRYTYDREGRLLATYHLKADTRSPDSIRYLYEQDLQPFCRIEYHHQKINNASNILTDSIFLRYDVQGRLLEEHSKLSGKHMLYRYSTK